MENYKLDLEIHDIWYIPFYKSKLFISILILIIFLILIFLFLLFKNKKKLLLNKNLSNEDLLNNLDHLSKNIEKIKTIDLYTNLILILKQFILINFQKNLFCKTEEELVIFLKDNNIAFDFISEIKNLVNNAILTKFANNDILKMQIINDLEICIKLIKMFKPFKEGNSKTT